MRLIPLFIVALALPAAPVAAQQVNWAGGGAAYEAGRASGTTQVTRGEYAMCAAYWSEWATAAQQDRVPQAGLAALAEVNKVLAPPDVGMMAFMWLLLVSQDEATEDMFEDYVPRAEVRVAAFLKGEAGAERALFETLGSCAEVELDEES